MYIFKLYETMPYCSVKWCGKSSATSSYKKDGITFHRFSKIPEVRDKWILATKRENWCPANHHVICSRHFTSDCFESLKNHRRLFNSAVPTLLLPSLGLQEENCENLISQDIQSDDPISIRPSLSSPTASAADHSIEDLTPRERKMKRHIDHLTNSLKRKTKLIKELQDKNRLLNKKVADQKKMMHILMKKSCIAKLTNKND